MHGIVMTFFFFFVYSLLNTCMLRPSSNVERFMRRIKSFDLAHEKFDV